MSAQFAILRRMADGHVQVIRVAILHKTAMFSLKQQEVHFVEQETIVYFVGEPDAFRKEGITINHSLESIAPTPIDIGALESELDSYDSPDAAIILVGFKNAFKIYYEGPHEPAESKKH